MSKILEYIARQIVGDPDAVRVTERQGDGALILELEVAPEDVGKVIGRGGRVARAIRSVMRAAGMKAGVTTVVEIVG